MVPCEFSQSMLQLPRSWPNWRTDLTWMSTMIAGHLGRLANPILNHYQHADNSELSDVDQNVLHWLKLFVMNASPRESKICGPLRAPLAIYTDASFEADKLTLGWVIFDTTSSTQPIGGSCVVPPEVIASWLPRRQQIFAGETLCGLVIPRLHPQILHNRDAVWYIDNESAVSALVRGSSSQEDVHEIAQYAQLLFYLLKTRIWFEWIDSESNPSDGLSRKGVLDPWTQGQHWSVTNYAFPEGLSRGELLKFLSENRVFWTMGDIGTVGVMCPD